MKLYSVAGANGSGKNGVLYFQIPDGTITMDNPFEKGELKERLDALTGNMEK